MDRHDRRGEVARAFSYTIPAPPDVIQKACDGWINIAARRNLSAEDERQVSASRYSPIDETLFPMGSDSCCSICRTLRKALAALGVSDLDRRGDEEWEVSLSEYDHQFIEIFERGSVRTLRFVLPRGKTHCIP